jgi:antitoxin MazE
MKAQVQRWGNSLALRIPKPLAEDANVKPGSVVDLSVSRGRLVAVPVRPKAKVSLRSLLARITKKNLHGEIDSGVRVGREAW